MIAGWETWLVPEAHVHHPIAASQGGVTERWYVALHDYYARSAPRWSVVMFDLFAATGLTLRAMATRDRLHRRHGG